MRFSRPVRFPLKDTVGREWGRRARISAHGTFLAVVRPIPASFASAAIAPSESRYNVADVNEELASECTSVALPEFRIGAVRRGKRSTTSPNVTASSTVPTRAEGPSLSTRLLVSSGSRDENMTG